MRLNLLKFKKIILVVTVLSFVDIGCGAPEKEEEETEDSSETQLITINGEIFSIPSPIQTAFLIKKIGTNFNNNMLNPSKNYSSYTTNYKKALNLGIYGADLGYVTLYEQTQDALAYIQSVKKLADELGVSGAFDTSIINRFQNNIGNKDSLLVLVSVAYRASDAYLKNNERNDISALILAGGWIETLHFATNVAKTKNNEEIVKRVAEQKSSLESVIKLLTPYYKESEYTELIDKLNDLSTVFDGVESKYFYEKATVDIDKKTTTINSKTEVKITPEQLEVIFQKIQLIRNQIVG